MATYSGMLEVFCAVRSFIITRGFTAVVVGVERGVVTLRELQIHSKAQDVFI